MKLPKDTEVKAEIGIGQIEGGFGIDATLNIHLPGMSGTKRNLLLKKHTVCPYSNATRNNIDVRLNVTV